MFNFRLKIDFTKLTSNKYNNMFPKPLVTHQIAAFRTKVSCEMPSCQNQPLNRIMHINT